MLRYFLEYHLFLPVFRFDNYNGHPYTFRHFITNVFFYYFPSYFVYGLIYFFVSGWYKTKQHQQELEKENTAAELNFLRSQVNPHFLFNSINDIYSLTYQQSVQAPAALLKLLKSCVTCCEGKADTMPLQNEVTYLENVIELQRISAKGQAFINFTVEGYIETQIIATMLLVAFVENAFKHGVITNPEHPIVIHYLRSHLTSLQ
ncbi:histidine kinase [Mucilaginibacter polytrichastri]|uniref:Signal transduction histidine kinase internal region domain-containing protein n=1 Tax=Mucilaginibacter polytrichastri TaxID=1302689 RepID=A0A1Q5ZS13_9SPHI|nr:sensor histidine kinase [Mucilaginibacter polytrichastri]OKS84562.1 hypothetical protein RG47T_5252 [Mucilaginibacter polytrichastri]SFT23998.1 Histidine kinase [Mucilaginibacter polytrichastri]